ncbi:MAG: protein adenylyltransferase SelO [Rhodospirillales bacterium]
MINLPFKNRYLELGEGFYDKCKPSAVADPVLIKFNDELANELGLSANGQDEQDLAEVFSGNVIDDSSEPLAMVYAGHQFGHFNPQLGDGRAIYLGELDHVDGASLDIQLKGAGRTRYSRSGDGRSALGPVLREYLLSEAMHQLHIPTTRALAAVLTGEQVVRERMVSGAVMTRVASSFIRVGSFEYFAMKNDVQSIKALADYVIERNYPDVIDAANPYIELFESVVQRQASLISQWMQLGFIHGVMNTDNMSIAGETIDYGPCAFMDYFNHNQVYSSIDQNGRYAYSAQPDIGVWNLSRLAEALLPLFDDDLEKGVALAKEILEKYLTSFSDAWLTGFRAKCGLTFIADVKPEEDQSLLAALLDAMAANQADFTLTYYHLSLLDAVTNEKDAALRKLFAKPEAIDAWLLRWRQRLTLESTNDNERQASMQLINPVYIPRNHQVEAAIRAAEDDNDFSVFHALYDVLQKPFERQQGKDDYMLPPKPGEVVKETFCGT